MEKYLKVLVRWDYATMKSKDYTMTESQIEKLEPYVMVPISKINNFKELFGKDDGKSRDEIYSAIQSYLATYGLFSSFDIEWRLYGEYDVLFGDGKYVAKVLSFSQEEAVKLFNRYIKGIHLIIK